MTESYKPKDQDDAERMIKELMARTDIGLIAVVSSFVRGIKDRRLSEAITSSILPLVIELPEYGERIAEDTLRKLIIRAIGIDVQAS